MPTIKVIALFYDQKPGLEGWIGGITPDGEPLGICSKESWEEGYQDSLRTGWIGHIKIFNAPKTIYCDSKLKDCKDDFVNWKLTVPIELKKFLK